MSIPQIEQELNEAVETLVICHHQCVRCGCQYGHQDPSLVCKRPFQYGDCWMCKGGLIS